MLLDEPSSEQAPLKYDDNFYDLDDDFIDDGNLEIVDDLPYDVSSGSYLNMSQSEKLNMDEDEEEKEGVDKELDEEEQEIEANRVETDRRYNRLLKRFKVMLPDDVKEMMQ